MSRIEHEQTDPIGFDIPLDASGIEDFTPDLPVKVVVVAAEEVVHSEIVKLDEKGRGNVRVELKRLPGGLRIFVGPYDASDEDLQHLQTISRTVPARALAQRDFKLAPIVISPYYWFWWRRWCRTFVITGRVVCPDGKPVPGAKVCAFDVDWWWWWSSYQQVGCDTTDANGSFTIKFRWCCGWWPWWWWRLRYWQLESLLVDRLVPVLELVPDFPIPVPDPRPNLDIFAPLAARDGHATTTFGAEVDLSVLPTLREQLLVKLPVVPELERLRIWPWFPWQPWWDCTPDIVFRVTQDCQGSNKVIVNETIWDARWNIPTNLSVTLVARGACCVQDDPPPEGNCVLISHVCSSLVDSIGGNLAAPLMPAGYLNPGAIAVSGDRPFAGVVPISGQFGSSTNVDYYEFEWSTSPMGPWNAMPPPAAGGFTRSFWGPALPAGPVNFHNVNFAFTPVSGRLVIESREHFEAANGAGTWGTTRFWVVSRDLLMQWLTATTFSDGTYYLRLVGYQNVGSASNPQLGDPQILPICNTQQDNFLTLTIDNSTSALEPAADIVDVRINGVSAGPCSNVDARAGGVLEVDFVAYDVDQHLAFYSLIATYGRSLSVNLLTAPGATLTPIALGAIPPAVQVGPDYGAARMQGATAPHWRGGGLRLTIPDLRNAFPETCCYQLELRVYKRTIVSCDYNYTPNKLSFYSLTVVV